MGGLTSRLWRLIQNEDIFAGNDSYSIRGIHGLFDYLNGEFMTDTDKIREKFDEWEANVDDDDLCERFRRSSFVDFDSFMLFEAYQQGQRDLIEAMGEPVVYEMTDKFAPIPLYKLPDHLSKAPQNIDTSGGHGDGVDR